MEIIEQLVQEFSLDRKKIENVVALLEDSATIPFIARYRKEATGSLDETALRELRDRYNYFKELEERKLTIIKTIEEQGNLTEELKAKIDTCLEKSKLEDLYLPFKPKRRTRASVAKKRGLEPLAQILLEQKDQDLSVMAASFVNVENDIDTAEDALSGARDIIAEWVAEDRTARAQMRALFFEKGLLTSKVHSGKEEEGAKYRDYFDCTEPLRNAPSHRILAMRRGEDEDILTLRIDPPEGEALTLLEALFVTGHLAASEQVKLAVHDGYKRLLCHSMETEARVASKKAADKKSLFASCSEV